MANKQYSFSIPLSEAPRVNSPIHLHADLLDIYNSIAIIAQQCSVQTGTTANRPTPLATQIGLMYLDTTLAANGKPIWWNGANWVDYSGTVV